MISGMYAAATKRTKIFKILKRNVYEEFGFVVYNTIIGK